MTDFLMDVRTNKMCAFLDGYEILTNTVCMVLTNILLIFMTEHFVMR